MQNSMGDKALLFQAAYNGDFRLVKHLVEQKRLDPNHRDDNGYTPLQYAAANGKVEIVKYFIEERCIPAECPSLLHIACIKNECKAVVSYLVEKHGFDPSAKNEQGNSALHLAAASCSLDILMYFVQEKHCSLKLRNQFGRQPFHVACEHKENLPMVIHMVEAWKCDPNVKDADGNTALNIAASAGCLDILKYFIEERHCSARCPGQWGRSLLHNACQFIENLNMVKYLIEKHKCDFSEKDEQGDTPLNVAAFSGSTEILTYLIEDKNCSPRCPGQFGRSPLHNACRCSENLAMVIYLVEHAGCDPSWTDDEGNTPLNVAAFSGNLGILKYLMEERNCSPKCVGRWGRTPLHNACGKRGNQAMVKYLVDHGCDPNAKDADGDTPLNIAALFGNLDTVMYLVTDLHCIPESLGELGRSPLHNACQNKENLTMVIYLVESLGCDPFRKDDHGNTPLNVAAFSGCFEILKYLIEDKKCNPKCVGRWGRTPLHNASGKSGNLAMVQYLVENQGCQLVCRDQQNNTPLDVATTNNVRDIREYLLCQSKLKTSPLLRDLTNDIAAEIPAKWRLVGNGLSLTPAILDNIQDQNAGRSNAHKDSFEQVLIQWDKLKIVPYTWETIINVLKSPSVDEKDLSSKILDKYMYCK